MAFNSRHTLVPFVLLALLCCSGLSSASGSSHDNHHQQQQKGQKHLTSQGDLPQAVPDRSHIRHRQLRTISYMEFEDQELDIDALMGPGDSGMGGYGYYSPPPAEVITESPTDAPTFRPSNPGE